MVREQVKSTGHWYYTFAILGGSTSLPRMANWPAPEAAGILLARRLIVAWARVANLIASLKAAGTRVYLEIGSHDYIVPGVDQFRFAKLLDAKGIPSEQRINYLAGHWNHWDNVKVIVSAMSKIAKKESSDGIFQAGQKSYFRVNPVLGQTEPVDGPRFTLEVPRYITPSIEGFLIATGLPGTQFKIGGSNNGNAFEIKGTLASDGTFTSKITSLSVGLNVINSVQLLKPGSLLWISLDLSRSTTKWNPGNLVVEVLSSDSALVTPSVSGIAGTIVSGFLGADFSGANGPELKSVTYGISE